MKLKQFLDKRTVQLLEKRTDKGQILTRYPEGMMPETWSKTRPADRTVGTIPTSEPVDPNELCGETIGVEHREGRRPKIIKCQILKTTIHEHHSPPRVVGSVAGSMHNERVRI